MLNFFESILYGFVSGCAEILPISLEAHQAIMLKLFGINQKLPFCDLLIHIAILAAVIIGCRGTFLRIRRESRAYSRSRNRTYRTAGHYEMRLLRTVSVPLVLGQLFRISADSLQLNYVWIAIFLLINGLFLFVQEYMPHSNKKASQMTSIDSVLMGVFSALSVLPGISRNGVLLSYSITRGADKQSAVNWLLLLSVPALIVLCIFDVVGIVSLGFGIASFVVFLCYLLAALLAFAGAYLAILLLRILAVHTGFGVFTYYSWGAALFTIVLYLIS